MYGTDAIRGRLYVHSSLLTMLSNSDEIIVVSGSSKVAIDVKLRYIINFFYDPHGICSVL